jgi:hypothetical protein
MTLVAVFNGYRYYSGIDKNGKVWYNIIPEKEIGNSHPAFAGYGSAEYICKVKGLPNLF